MSTTTLTYPSVIRIRRALAIGLIVILIVTSLVLITGAILVIASSPIRDTYQADLIPVVNISTNTLSVAVPVPTPPTADTQPTSSETPTPASIIASEPSVIPVPVPTPPSS